MRITPKLLYKRTILLALSLSLFAPLMSTAQDVTEIQVTQKIPGPPLWELRYQGNTVWLFADVSPVPRRFNWDSSYIERIIAASDEFLSKPELDLNVGVPTPFKIIRVTKLQNQRMKNQSGPGLDQILDSESLLTFKNIMDEWKIHHPTIMNYKPFFAASILYDNVLEKTKMDYSTDVLAKLDSLRSKHRVQKTKTEISYTANDFIEYLEEARSLPADFGTQCLGYLMEKMLEMPAVIERSALWYQRDISFREFTVQENICIKNYREDTQSNLTRQDALKQLWYENLERAITSNKNTFAVVDINLFALPSREFYQWVEEKGFELKEPR